ncbi:MAG: glycosyltransferase, partial [Blastocatellia bacterium]
SDYGETWGLVVNEAMVSGLPAIVSDRVGCAPDLIEEGVTGYTFPFGNVESLASLMVEPGSSREKMRSMGQNARAKIRNYSLELAVEGTVEAVKYTLDKKRGFAADINKPLTGANSSAPRTVRDSTLADRS